MSRENSAVLGHKSIIFSKVIKHKVAYMSTFRKTIDGCYVIYTRGTISLRIVPRTLMSRAVIPLRWKIDVARRLQAARRGAGHSQAQIAELLGIQEKTYAKYEGTEKPNPIPQHMIGTLCRLLDLDPLVLLDGYGRDATRGKRPVRIK